MKIREKSKTCVSFIKLKFKIDIMNFFKNCSRQTLLKYFVINKVRKKNSSINLS